MQNDKLEIEYAYLEPEEPRPLRDETYYEKKYMMKMIHAYSHYKNLEDIKQYVDTHYHPDHNMFINEHELEAIKTVANGTQYFCEKLANEKKQKMMNDVNAKNKMSDANEKKGMHED